MTTGVIYDERMGKEHRCLWDSKYNEKPERFASILKRCKELQLLNRCVSIKPRDATEEELLKVHTPDMITILKSTDGNVNDETALEELSSHYDFIFIDPSTYSLSLLAAGSTVELVSQILDGNVKNGMAILRPPGHHAMKSEYCGYCYYNNVAIAAQHALDDRGIKRILIVDWDIHHGQATQQMFYDDPRVLYFSIHGYQNGAFWPHLRETDYHNIGRGAGLGYNINVPLNDIKMGNSDYLAIFHQLLLPIAYEFNPELVIVSAGYDAALGCPEGEMEVTPACYSHFTNSLMGLANGRVAVVLEGGYCLKSLAEGAALTLRTLLGDPCPVIPKLDAPTESARNSILSVKYVLRKFWKCLNPLEMFDVNDIKDAKNVGKNQFWPGIEFRGNDDKPDKYPTRDICPVQDPNIAALLDVQLNEIISGTSLDVPQFRVAFANNLADSSLKLPDIVQRCFMLPPIGKDTQTEKEASGLIFSLVDGLVDGKFRSGVAVAENINENIISALKYATTKCEQERVMFVDWRIQQNNEIQDAFQQESNILCVSLRAPNDSDQSTFNPEFVGLDKGKGFTVNINLPQGNSGNAEILAAVFRVLLPIAYQFEPQLIIVASDISPIGSEVSPDCFAQVIHLLTSLAGGRVAVIFDQIQLLPPVNELENCTKVLLGDTLLVPNGTGRELDFTVASLIRKVIQAQNPYWNAFSFNVQFPDTNVLIPPWMNDLKVAQHNPELHNI